MSDNVNDMMSFLHKDPLPDDPDEREREIARRESEEEETAKREEWRMEKEALANTNKPRRPHLPGELGDPRNLTEPDRHGEVTYLGDCEGTDKGAESKPAPKRVMPSDTALAKMIAAQAGRRLSEIPVLGKGADDPFWQARNEYQMTLNAEKPN